MSEMLGKTYTSVVNGGDTMTFTCDDGTVYRFYHSQDCCESVDIEDITGDLNDLVGSRLLICESVDGETPIDFVESDYESVEWTFYKFATIKGYVDVRWFGTSNGYYSTCVSLCKE